MSGILNFDICPSYSKSRISAKGTIKDSYEKYQDSMRGDFDPEKFELARKNFINTMMTAPVGEIVSSDLLYDYILDIHPEELYEGDNIIEQYVYEYDRYRLVNIPMENIPTELMETDEERVGKYGKKLSDKGTYPPIVVRDDYMPIDGNHRVKAMKLVGEESVRGFVPVGVENYQIRSD